MGARLKWNGDRLIAKAALASKAGCDRTMSKCVTHAKDIHKWHNEIGFAEGSIHTMTHAALSGGRVSGRWGSDANYFLFLEIGTSRADSGAPRAETRMDAAAGNMSAITPPQPEGHPLMIARPALRPAADAEYPLLKLRIGQSFKGQAMA